MIGKEKMQKKEEVSKRRKEKRNRKRWAYGILCLFIVGVIGLSVYNVISVELQHREVLAE